MRVEEIWFNPCNNFLTHVTALIVDPPMLVKLDNDFVLEVLVLEPLVAAVLDHRALTWAEE